MILLFLFYRVYEKRNIIVYFGFHSVQTPSVADNTTTTSVSKMIINVRSQMSVAMNVITHFVHWSSIAVPINGKKNGCGICD